MNLLFTVSCGIALNAGPIKIPDYYRAQGLFVCSKETPVRRAVVKLPPTKGQFIVENEQAIIDLFDFDTTPDNKGFWLWKKTIQKDTDAAIELPQSKLPSILSVVGESTGIQVSAIYYTMAMKALANSQVNYSCGLNQYQIGKANPWAAGPSVGGCIALENSMSSVSVAVNGPAVVRATGCINSVKETKSEAVSYDFKVSDCILDLRVTTQKGIDHARIIYSHRSRTAELMSDPVFINEWRRPLKSDVFEVKNNCAYAWNKQGEFVWACQ